MRKSKSLPDPIADNEIVTPDQIPGIDIVEKAAYLYLIKCWQQPKIATTLGLSQQTISNYFCKFKQSPELKKRMVDVWQKDITVELRRKSGEILQSIDSKKMVEGSKAQSIGILIDKARLIDGESTANIAYADFSRELADIEQEERALAARLE